MLISGCWLQVRWEDEQAEQGRGAGRSVEEEAAMAVAADSSGAKAVGPRYDTGADQMQVTAGGVASPAHFDHSPSR